MKPCQFLKLLTLIYFIMEITDNTETIEAETWVVPEEDVIAYLEEEETTVNTQEQQDNWNTNNE